MADLYPDGAPTLVFVHGVLDDAAIWQGVTSALQVPEGTVVAVDLAGMSGRPDEPGPYSLDGYANDVVAALDGISTPIVLIGHSIGAQIVELAAVARPDNVVGLVLIAPIPLAGTQLPEEAVAPLKSVGGSVAALRESRLQASPNFPEPELTRISEAGARIAPDAASAFVDLWNFGVPKGREATAFPGPVLVIRGEVDPLATGELIEAGVMRRFGGATLNTVGGAGHWIHGEQPATVAGLLRQFVAGLTPAR
ncbi:MAG: putative hydrolase or acyltransferase of alpha/beta superfamily [Mycobacterium sp.]|nr:putative hydrolase or acyltransferase of alpha/beta superfamily [Mycobacterium sp.]